MIFTNKHPKSETTIVNNYKTGDLAKAVSQCTIHYRDYKGYLDAVHHYTLTGDKLAWLNGIREEFKYDCHYKGQNGVKKEYKDSYGRVLKVEFKEITY